MLLLLHFVIMKSYNVFIPLMNKNILFIVGENAIDNFDVIDNADPNDYWFHINDGSSCHVVASMDLDNHIKLSKKEKKYIIKKGAEICKMKSKYKSNQYVSVVFTKIKNVVKTDIVGQVHLLERRLIEI